MDKDIYFPVCPGVTLKEMLVDRGVSAEEFAIQVGLSIFIVYPLLEGGIVLTDGIAKALAGAGLAPVSFWAGLEESYRLDLFNLGGVPAAYEMIVHSYEDSFFHEFMGDKSCFRFLEKDTSGPYGIPVYRFISRCGKYKAAYSYKDSKVISCFEMRFENPFIRVTDAQGNELTFKYIYKRVRDYFNDLVAAGV